MCPNLSLKKHKNFLKMMEKWFQLRIIDFKIACLTRRSKVRITDLKIGCLLKIFKHVGLRDLLSLADSNEYLKRAAECAFVQRYGRKKLWLYKVRAYEFRHYSTYTNILVEDFKTSLQLLRCFGHLISHLEINEDEDSDEMCPMLRTMYKYLFSYINEYCSKYLMDITFVMIPKGSLELLKNPFYRAKTVNLFGCHFGRKMTSLETLFPNLLCLKLDFNDTVEPKIIEEHWHRMKHLEINIDKKNFTRENIEEVLCLNPQLRRLKIGAGWSADFLEDISIFLQFIEVLEFGRLFEGFSDYIGKPIHFDSVKKLKLAFDTTKSNEFPNIPLSFVQLEELTLDTNHELNEEFYKFAGRNQTINKIIIPPSSETTGIKGNRFEFRKEIAYLKDINLGRYIFPFHDVIQLLQDFKSVTKFTFQMEKHDQFEHLVTAFANNWRVKKISMGKSECVEMTRRAIESSFEYIRQFLES